MLVIAKGVVKTGVIARATWRLLATVTTAAQALRRLIVPVGVASALMNTTPLVAMLIPAARQLQQTREVPAREVLLPVAHATTLTGSVTRRHEPVPRSARPSCARRSLITCDWQRTRLADSVIVDALVQ